MSESRAQDESELQLHVSHLIWLRAAPYFLAVVGLGLVLMGTLGAYDEAKAITFAVLGTVTCVTAAVISRSGPLKFGKEGVDTSLQAITTLDPPRSPVQITVTPGGGEPPRELPAVNDASTSGPLHTALPDPPSVAAIIATATAAGWIVDQEPGKHEIMLTKVGVRAGRRWSAGDTVSVRVPTDKLLAPLPDVAWIILTELGFPGDPS